MARETGGRPAGKVERVFSGIVGRFVEYERQITELQAQIRALGAELEESRKQNALLQAKIKEYNQMCARCRMKTEAVKRELMEYNKLVDALLKASKNPKLLVRAYAGKKG